MWGSVTYSIGHCCTADNFQVDIRSHPQSSWNISAGKVFAADFVVKYPDAKIDNVDKRFSKHLGYITKDYMHYGTKSPEHLSLREASKYDLTNCKIARGCAGKGQLTAS